MSDLEFKKQFGVCFSVSGNKRKFLDVKVRIIPLANLAGADTWYVYRYYKTKRKFIEEHNKTWSSPQVIDTPDLVINPTNILLNPDDYDL